MTGRRDTCAPWQGDQVCVTAPQPVPLAGVYAAETEKFDDPLNLVLPVERRIGYYPAILGIGYARDADGAGVIPPHFTKIEFAQLNEDGSVATAAAKYVLLDGEVRFFTVLSDGERSIVPPYVGGGQQPYGFVITSVGAGGPLGQFRYFWRWMPRDSRYPGMTGCL